MSEQSRRVRVTLRCYTDDFGLEVPNRAVEMLPDHALVQEVQRVCESAPQGLRRITSIESPPVFKVRHSRWRGAIWLDEERGIVWLLAAAWREEGSRSDAYEEFKRLHCDGRLLPDDSDYLRDQVETVARFLRELPRQAEESLAVARDYSGRDIEGNLCGTLPIRLCVEHESDLDAIWVAIRGTDVYGDYVKPELRDVIFDTYKRLAGPGAWDTVYCWRDGRSLRSLGLYECARYGLAEV